MPALRSCRFNPVENIWQFMRDNWLSNRVFKSHNDIVDQDCMKRLTNWLTFGPDTSMPLANEQPTSGLQAVTRGEAA
jgi:hypothetical protein